MSPLARLHALVFGSAARMRRLLRYWMATAVLYACCVGLLRLQAAAGVTRPEAATALSLYGLGGVVLFYALVRASAALGIAPQTLAMLQGLFAISCAMATYAVSGPLRMAALALPVVAVAFCTFALRPRQTLLLAAAGVLAMGATMWSLQAHDPVRHPPPIEAIAFGYGALALLSIALLTAETHKLRTRLKRQKEELQEAVATIRTLATVDELTKLANRRHMNEVLQAEQRRQGRGASTCVALLDIDFFKDVNDRYGHAAGDDVLRQFASVLRAELRPDDVLARWGGEEFLLMLPETEPIEAQLVLRRMAERVRVMQVPGLRGRRVSFSGGLAARRGDEPFGDTIGRADKALYQAKEAGRDRLVTA